MTLSRVLRGVGSAASGLAFPLGGWWLGGLAALRTPERLARGLAVVLPGVEGGGPLNWSIARGLIDGGWPGAVVVHDWTTGLWPLFAFHLRASGRNRRRAAALAEVIVRYRHEHPGRPVHLLGHSGGGALAVWALEALPASCPATAAFLFGPALSPGYPLGSALSRVERGVWNFWSPLDLIILAAGTLLFGTLDGHHTIAAGCRGFHLSADARLRQECYRPAMARRFHLGGHFGWTNRVWVAEAVAPLLSLPTPQGVGYEPKAP